MKFELLENKSSDENNYLYRYEDDYDRIRLRKFRIVRETNCGWWIERYPWFEPNNEKFVYKQGKNNFAKKTKKEAMENYYHRKLSHIAILNDRLIRTRVLLRKAESVLHEEAKGD